jgi:hypothetical protein
MICARVLARSAYSQSAQDRQIGIAAGSLLGPGLTEPEMLLLPLENRRSVRTGEVSRGASARKRYALGEVRILYFEVQIADFSAVSTDGAM